MRAAKRQENEARSEAFAGRAHVAAYVASLSADLSALASRNGLPTLAYVLDIARLEAEEVARQAQGDAPTAG